MKRLLIAAMVLLLAVWVTYFAYAADPMGSMSGGKMDSNSMMMHKEMMGKMMPQMCPMHTMMAQGMMHKEIVATQDGGVIVMYDNKLLKYDKDVNFVKEVDLKIDTAAMQVKMQQMMKECMEKCQMMKPQDKSGSM
jgi:hypothetical protein